MQKYSPSFSISKFTKIKRTIKLGVTEVNLEGEYYGVYRSVIPNLGYVKLMSILAEITKMISKFTKILEMTM